VTTASSPSSAQTVELPPSYSLPIALTVSAVPLLLVQAWVSLAIGLFGLFLMFQAATIRLRFTATDLDLYRGETLFRSFPYRYWQNWRIFWSPIPILFYFKEIESIHFLPILFDPKMLQTCLESRIPLDNLP
jgi:hypothetical protein